MTEAAGPRNQNSLEAAAYVLKAEGERRQGHLERAEAILRMGAERSGLRVSARVLEARILFQRGDKDAALRKYQQVLDHLDGANLPALRALGVAAAEAGRGEEAIRFLDRWLAESDDPEAEALAESLREQDQAAPVDQASARIPGGDDLADALEVLRGGDLENIDDPQTESRLLDAPSIADPEAWSDPDASPKRKDDSK